MERRTQTQQEYVVSEGNRSDGRAACAHTPNAHDSHLQPLVRHRQGRRGVLTHTGFHALDGSPPLMKICPRGAWNVRIVTETDLFTVTQVCRFARLRSVWEYFQAHRAFPMAAFNILAHWVGLTPEKHGFVHLSIARVSL